MTALNGFLSYWAAQGNITTNTLFKTSHFNMHFEGCQMIIYDNKFGFVRRTNVL